MTIKEKPWYYIIAIAEGQSGRWIFSMINGGTDLVLDDHLVEIAAKQLIDNAKMALALERVVNANNVRGLLARK